MNVSRATFEVLRTPGGRYKVYVWGSADGHFSDWRGSNYRICAVSGQPHRGYATATEAFEKLIVLLSFPERREAELNRARRRAGTFFSDNCGYEFVSAKGDVNFIAPARVI